MQTVTLSENAVAVLRFRAMRCPMKIREQDREAFRELVDAGIMKPDGASYRFTDDGQHETASYKEMLRTFNAENGAEARITLSDSLLDNDMATDDTGRKNELDYVLIAANGCPLSVQRARYVLRRQGWDTPPSVRSDLSYRYAVGATVAFGAPESPVREDRPQ